MLFAPQVMQASHAAEGCDAPQPVCEWKSRIVGIKTPNMIATGTVLDNGFIVTNRHVAEDHPRLLTRDETGSIAAAFPQPHPVQVDLVLLRPTDRRLVLRIGRPAGRTAQQLYVVAFDQGRNGARVYQPGSWAIYPADGASTRRGFTQMPVRLPGNSGGAVVDRSGNLIGILASGDGRISEVIPAAHIASVAAVTSREHVDDFTRTGTAIRQCADALHDAAQVARDPSAEMVSTIEQDCEASGNKQLFDQAGQTFGRWWMFGRSRQFLERSLAVDPDSPNTLMSMAVTLHLDRDLAAELPILKRYIEIDPSKSTGAADGGTGGRHSWRPCLRRRGARPYATPQPGGASAGRVIPQTGIWRLETVIIRRVGDPAMGKWHAGCVNCPRPDEIDDVFGPGVGICHQKP